jgi:hypothetical protein
VVRRSKSSNNSNNQIFLVQILTISGTTQFNIISKFLNSSNNQSIMASSQALILLFSWAKWTYKMHTRCQWTCLKPNNNKWRWIKWEWTKWWWTLNKWINIKCRWWWCNSSNSNKINNNFSWIILTHSWCNSQISTKITKEVDSTCD